MCLCVHINTSKILLLINEWMSACVSLSVCTLVLLGRSRTTFRRQNSPTVQGAEISLGSPGLAASTLLSELSCWPMNCQSFNASILKTCVSIRLKESRTRVSESQVLKWSPRLCIHNNTMDGLHTESSSCWSLRQLTSSERELIAMAARLHLPFSVEPKTGRNCWRLTPGEDKART